MAARPGPVNFHRPFPMPTATLARDTPPSRADWQAELADAIRDPRELCASLGLDPAIAVGTDAATESFALLVPRGFVARMRHGDPLDPLLLQVLPRRAETAEVSAEWSGDPLREGSSLKAPALVQKYAGRALLLLAAGCGVNCRYCFRREFPYAASGATRRGIAAGLEAIAADTALTEVILSGGDPLLCDDEFLGEVIERLDAIPHLRRIRIHTRLPIVVPSRVTAGLLAALAASRLARVIVLHANHPAEIDSTVADAVRRLAATPAIMLNQAVLLAGVNDSAAVLAALSERLVEAGITPYYLHLLDRVRGAAHFDVPHDRAEALHRTLRETLPGYAVPRLVRETPGAASKSWIA